MPFSTYNYFADREFLQAEYVVEQKSAKQIARECGCSHSTILNHLREFGIAIRTESPTYRRGQIPYGTELVNGKLQVDELEAAVIRQIKEFRSKGFSYHRIAEILNILGIITKNKASRWHASTVMKIVKRNPEK